MQFKKICILGGSGFVGSALCSQLVKHGYEVNVLTRQRERHRDLLVLPRLKLIEADVHDSRVLVEQFTRVDAVINLVGVLHNGKGKDGFQQTHVDLARKILSACQQAGIKRILHMSALNADSGKGTSRYLRSKGEAETIIHNTAHISVTSFRPSVIFGPGDSFLNRFAGILKMVPRFAPFMLACPNARFAPVYVEDVAKCYTLAINNSETFGKRYDLCGPKQYTLKRLVEYVAELIGKKRTVIGLNDSLSKLQASIFEMLPGKVFTVDNYNSMKIDSVCHGPFPGVFGLQPTPLESVAPKYIHGSVGHHGYRTIP